jgi:hypothetical protein
VCATDIGPALAVGGSLGSNILTSKTLGGSDADGLGLGAATSPSSLLPSDLSDTSDSDEDFQPSLTIASAEQDAFIEVPRCPVLHSEGKETLSAVFPCNIDQLFTMLFTNSKFFLDLHTSRNTFSESGLKSIFILKYMCLGLKKLIGLLL